MKNKSPLLVMALTILTAATAAAAVEPVYSPKAADHAYSLRRVPDTTPDMIDRTIRLGTPKSREFAYSLRKVPSVGPKIDLAHAPRPLLSPKDPRFEAAWHANAFREFQVAPLK